MAEKLMLGVTVGGSSRLLDGQPRYFKIKGYEVSLVSQDHFKEDIFVEKEGIPHWPVKNLVPDISPIKDIKALFEVFRIIKKAKPDIVNFGTPKMALLGLISARILGVKKRVYTCRGLRFETISGNTRRILILMEKLTAAMAHKVIFVSPSLAKAAESYNICDPKKGVVIGKGSSNGVNTEAFNRDKIDSSKRQELINQFGLEGKLVIGFVGRVTEEKGVLELMDVFEELYEDNNSLRLIMMGHIKCDEDFEKRFKNHPGVIYVSFQDDVPLFMSLFDIFVLPSHREGFPSVPVQAAAMGLPVVVSDATGCVDSVDDGVNGFIFKKGNREDLKSKLKAYSDSPSLRAEHGKNGIEWAKEFTNERIWEGIEKVYKSL